VALKTITTGLAEFPELLQRFYQEAQSAGSLQHPHIVTIFDMGDEGGIPYIAMELVDGESLEQLIVRRTSVAISVKLMYAHQACRAFDYAHKRGIVHRDIKPDNVMLTKDGTVKVVDFGIARVLETSRTQTGMLLGTFAYMSPEQYHGEHADARSDIWSFGVLLYELLAYERPFKGHTPAGLMHSICSLEPTPLSAVLPSCPPALEKILQQMLRKSAADRYQSMEDLLLDLDPLCKSLQSESMASLMEQSQQSAEQGDFPQARDLLRQVLQIDSTYAPARTFLDRVNVELRRVRVRPRVQKHIEAGLSLLAQGKTQEANAEAEMALQLDTDYEPAQQLQRRVQDEIRRAQQIAEWIEASRRRLAEGNPDEAEQLIGTLMHLGARKRASKDAAPAGSGGKGRTAKAGSLRRANESSTETLDAAEL
jgi:serine/threonine protein kinase